MNDEIILILVVLLGLAALLLVMPIVALVKASRARRETEELAGQLKELGREVMLLKHRVAEGVPVATTPAQQPSTSAAPVAPPVPMPVPVVFAAQPPPVPAVTSAPLAPTPPALPPEFEPAPPLADTVFANAATPPLPPPVEAPVRGPSAPPPVPDEPAPAFNWEQFMGVKLFAWLGGFVLLLTAVFFLKYSVDHGWIPRELRAALGFLAGAGLVVGGLWSIRRDYSVAGQTLTGTGIVVLYAVTFACRAYYKFDFFNGAPAGALMVLITATAFLLAVRLNAQVVAILGLLGGFLTPLMLSTGVDNPPGLFGFIALLDIGLLAVVLHRRWNYMAALAAAGTVVMEIGWADKFFALEKLPTAVVVLTVFGALFALAVGVARRLGRSSDWLASAAILPPVVALGFSLYFTSLQTVAAQPSWVLGNILLADLVLLAIAVLYRPFARLQVAAGLAAFAVTAIWIGAAATNELLPWAMGFVVLLAGLHAVFPFVLEKLQPGAEARRWSALFPPVGLLLMLIPLASLDEVGWWLWPAVLLLNLLALAAAAVTRLLAALLAAFLLTLVVLGIAILQLPSGALGGGRELLLVAGCAIFFCAGTVWLVRRFGGNNTDTALPPAWLALMPDATAALPFLLLVMIVLKLELANPSEVFGVVLLLDALLLGLAAVTRRGAPVLAAFVGTLLVEYCWFGQWGSHIELAAALPWFVGFAALFLVYPFTLRRRLLAIQPPWAAAALALPLHFTLIHRSVTLIWPNNLSGALAAICVLPPLFGLITLLRSIPSNATFRLNRLAWFGAATLFFITLIFPLQFSDQPHWTTISWALEGAALFWLFHRIPHPGLRLTGVALLVAVFVRLILNPAVLHYAERSSTPIFNWILLTYGVAALCCFAGLRLLAPPRDRVLGFPAPALLGTLGTILAFALVNLEIADYFTAENSWIRLEFFSGGFARGMSYTIAWALFALVLLIVGLARSLKAARYAAIALLGVACAKLILHDLDHLDQIYRIAAFFVVAVVAIAYSFLYQRFFRNSAKS